MLPTKKDVIQTKDSIDRGNDKAQQLLSDKDKLSFLNIKEQLEKNYEENRRWFEDPQECNKKVIDLYEEIYSLQMDLDRLQIQKLKQESKKVQLKKENQNLIVYSIFLAIGFCFGFLNQKL